MVGTYLFDVLRRGASRGQVLHRRLDAEQRLQRVHIARRLLDQLLDHRPRLLGPAALRQQLRQLQAHLPIARIGLGRRAQCFLRQRQLIVLQMGPRQGTQHWNRVG